MSTLSFLPYITEYFSKEYIIPNYLGESLSSLVPGLLAMFQSYGRPEKPCMKNSSNSSLTINNQNSTNKLNLVVYSANYSVSLYFGLLFVLILSSIISFTWLNYSETAFKARKKKASIEPYLEMENLTETNQQQDLSVSANAKVLRKKRERNEKRILLSLAFLTCFINYGYLPGLLSVCVIFFFIVIR